MMILTVKVQDAEPLKLEVIDIDEAERLAENIIKAHSNLVDLGFAGPIESIDLLEYYGRSWKFWAGTYDDKSVTFAEVLG